MPIEIIPHQPRWHSDARLLNESVIKAIGDRVVRVDHIGSTSVPGLASKDVIDLQLVVEDLPLVEEFVGRLEALGFEYRADYSHDHVPPWAEDGPDWEKRYFSKRSPPRAHVHVRAVGRANTRYALLFRDYLRAVPAAAAVYAAFKQKLAATDADYVDVKDTFCDMVLIAAEAWAVEVGWS